MPSMDLLIYFFNVHIIEGTAVKDIAMTTGHIMSPQVHLLYIDILSMLMRFKGAYRNLYTIVKNCGGHRTCLWFLRFTKECIFSAL